MKLFLLINLFVLTFSFSAIKTIKDLDQGLTKDVLETKVPTLVIFDIDNTLIEPVQHLGSDQWFRREVANNPFKNFKMSPQEIEKAGKEFALDRWRKVQSITNVRLVETGTGRAIRALQSNPNVRILGLTARPLDLAYVTRRQLKDVSIFLDNKASAISNMDINLSDETDLNAKAGYEGGILYVGENPKGKGANLLNLLKKTNQKPQRIYFFDDREENVKDLDAALAKAKLDGLDSFTSFWYQQLQAKVDKFNNPKENDQKIADIQLKHFGIMSDDQAEKLLKP